MSEATKMSKGDWMGFVADKLQGNFTEDYMPQVKKRMELFYEKGWTIKMAVSVINGDELMMFYEKHHEAGVSDALIELMWERKQLTEQTQLLIDACSWWTNLDNEKCAEIRAMYGVTEMSTDLIVKQFKKQRDGK